MIKLDVRNHHYIDIYQLFIGWEDAEGDGDSILVANFVDEDDAQRYLNSMLFDKTTLLGHPKQAKFVTLSLWQVVYVDSLDDEHIISESKIEGYLLPLFRRGVRK